MLKLKNNISTWLRIGYGLVIGALINFFLDVIFGLIYKEYSLFQSISKYIGVIIITYVVFELLIWINQRLSKKFNWESKPISKFIGQILINSVVAVVIVYGLRLIFALFFEPIDYIRLLNEMIIVGYILFIVAIFTTVDLIIFLLNRWRYSQLELERFKKENAEFKFEALRSQLNPHFLFNSLNTLSSLVYDNQEKADMFVRQLSDVYRYILDNRDTELVQLRNELLFADVYIKLMKVRFDNNLNVEVRNSPASEKLMIAPITLQLLIENAIKHNIVSNKYPLAIEINISDKEIEVRNNLQPKKNKPYSSELGLKNIISRYKFLTEQHVEVCKTEVDFTVKIPLI